VTERGEQAVARLATWSGIDRTVDLDGPVHYVEFSGAPAPGDGPPLVLVHGLGGSHLNWCLLAPLLVGHGRVVAVDLAGFGLTHPHGRSTSVQANADLLNRFLATVIGEPAVLVGNSMGGMVSILTSAEHPESVAGLVLVDPALPRGFGDPIDPLVVAMFAAYAMPVVGERFLARARSRRTPQQAVRDVLKLCLVDRDAVPADLLAASEALIVERSGVEGLDLAFLTAARSLLRVNSRPATYWKAMAGISVPVLLLHGEKDRLVPVRAARRVAQRHPDWRLVTIPNVGHTPQLEVPAETARHMQGWLATLPR
jgi:pimeloyl-ACP methyl ester carboxylesterase